MNERTASTVQSLGKVDPRKHASSQLAECSLAKVLAKAILIDPSFVDRVGDLIKLHGSLI